MYVDPQHCFLDLIFSDNTYTVMARNALEGFVKCLLIGVLCRPRAGGPGSQADRPAGRIHGGGQHSRHRVREYNTLID